LITLDRPFRYESAVFNNLGTFVGGVSGSLGSELLETSGNPLGPIRKNPVTGYYQVRLIWNGQSTQGQRIGTGAFIWRIKLTLPNASKVRTLSDSRKIGVLRMD
jgi:hypothetical protein